MKNFKRCFSSCAAIAEGLLDKLQEEAAEQLENDLADYCCDMDDEERLEYCDFCGEPTWLCGSLTVTRDYDEGLGSPAYRVCQKCYNLQQTYLQAELDEYETAC